MKFGKWQQTIKRLGTALATAGVLIFGLGLLFALRGHNGDISIIGGIIMISIGVIIYLLLSTGQTGHQSRNVASQ